MNMSTFKIIGNVCGVVEMQVLLNGVENRESEQAKAKRI